MMGMHGEAWVNHAIQEADLLIALGMRFDDRVTGNPANLCAQGEEDSRRTSTAPRSTRTSRSMCALVGDLRHVLESLLPQRRARRSRGVAHAHRRTQGRLGGSRHSEPARQRPSLCRARRFTICGAKRTATPSSSPTSASTRCGSAQYYKHECPRSLHHVGRAGHNGIRAAGGDRREVRPAGRGSLGASSATAVSR